MSTAVPCPTASKPQPDQQQHMMHLAHLQQSLRLQQQQQQQIQQQMMSAQSSAIQQQKSGPVMLVQTLPMSAQASVMNAGGKGRLAKSSVPVNASLPVQSTANYPKTDGASALVRLVEERLHQALSVGGIQWGSHTDMVTIGYRSTTKEGKCVVEATLSMGVDLGQDLMGPIRIAGDPVLNAAAQEVVKLEPVTRIPIAKKLLAHNRDRIRSSVMVQVEQILKEMAPRMVDRMLDSIDKQLDERSASMAVPVQPSVVIEHPQAPAIPSSPPASTV